MGVITDLMVKFLSYNGAIIYFIDTFNCTVKVEGVKVEMCRYENKWVVSASNEFTARLHAHGPTERVRAHQRVVCDEVGVLLVMKGAIRVARENNRMA